MPCRSRRSEVSPSWRTGCGQQVFHAMKIPSAIARFAMRFMR